MQLNKMKLVFYIKVLSPHEPFGEPSPISSCEEKGSAEIWWLGSVVGPPSEKCVPIDSALWQGHQNSVQDMEMVRGVLDVRART